MKTAQLLLRLGRRGVVQLEEIAQILLRKVAIRVALGHGSTLQAVLEDLEDGTAEQAPDSFFVSTLRGAREGGKRPPLTCLR